MQSAGTIVDGGENRLNPWEPTQTLSALTLDEVRFSRGFLRADPGAWFPTFVERWRPLFEKLNIDVEVFEIKPAFHFPENLERVVPIEIAGEPAVIGIDRPSLQNLAEAFAPGVEESGWPILAEYLEHRFLTTLEESWAGETPLHCSHLGLSALDQIEVTGVVHVRLLVSGTPVSFSLGLGIGAVETLDLFWREHFIRRALGPDNQVDPNEMHEISIELAELSVPRELIVDYLKGGTTIELELPVGDRAIIRKDGEPWAVGRLALFNGRFAVEVVDLEPDPSPSPGNAAKIQVELALTELDQGGCIELGQQGAVLLTRQKAVPEAALVMSGEEVAIADIGVVDGKFALQVVKE